MNAQIFPVHQYEAYKIHRLSAGHPIGNIKFIHFNNRYFSRSLQPLEQRHGILLPQLPMQADTALCDGNIEISGKCETFHPTDMGA